MASKQLESRSGSGFRVVRQGIAEIYDDESALGYVRGMTDTKSTAGRRRIDLSPEAIAVLKEHRKVQNGQVNPHDLVFPNSDGGFIDPSNFHRHAWRPLLKSAKVPHCRFHSLRHAGNSLLAQSGVSLPLLQRRLGHSSPHVTMAVYSHLGATEGQRGAAILGSLLSETKKRQVAPRTASKHKARVKEKA